MKESTTFPISDSSHVGEARRFAQNLAENHGFGETEAGKLAIITTELGTNLLKYGTACELVFRAIGETNSWGIEVLALDKGPGMENVADCLTDGYSTAGSPGTGLGATQRLADVFDIHSAPSLGTAVFCRVWASPSRPKGLNEIGAVSLAVKGENVCGDSWAAKKDAPGFEMLVADGLGHGRGAAEASQEAVRIFEQSPTEGPGQILLNAHDALRKTRGAAMAVAKLDTESRQIQFAGVGNISATIIDSDLKTRSLVSHNGTVGSAIRKVQEFSYDFPRGSLLIMHSDGISSRWQLNRYHGLTARHPSLVAGVIYRDYKRTADDSTVIVLKEGAI